MNEDSTRWSLAAKPGNLRIIGSGGDMYKSCDNPKNLLLQTAPDGDFEVTTKFSFTPTVNFQQAGVMIYEDMNNYLKLDALYNDVNQGGQNVEFILEHEGIFPDTRPWQSVDLNQAIYLKISKSDNTYTGYYGINGIQWVMLGSTTASKIKKPQLGIYAITGNADPELNCIGNVPDIVTDFDYFRVFPRKNVYLPLVRR